MGPSRGADEVRILEILSRREPLCSSSSSAVGTADAEVGRRVGWLALRGRVCDDSAEPLDEVELCLCRAGLASMDCCGVWELEFITSMLRGLATGYMANNGGGDRAVSRWGRMFKTEANFSLP